MTAGTTSAARQRKRRWWLAVLFALVSAGVLIDTFIDPDGWPRRAQLLTEVTQLRANNAQQQTQAELLERQIQALQTRRDVQERAIREELGYVRPGEIVIKLEADAIHAPNPDR